MYFSLKFNKLFSVICWFPFVYFMIYRRFCVFCAKCNFLLKCNLWTTLEKKENEHLVNVLQFSVTIYDNLIPSCNRKFTIWIFNCSFRAVLFLHESTIIKSNKEVTSVCGIFFCLVFYLRLALIVDEKKLYGLQLQCKMMMIYL